MARRHIQLESGAFGDFADLRKAVFLGSQEIRHHFRRNHIAAAGPDGHHAGLARHLAPLLGHVVNKERVNTWHRLFLRIALATHLTTGLLLGQRVNSQLYRQRRIADHQRRVGGGQHRHRVGRHIQKFRRDAPEAAAKQTHQGRRGARVGVQCDAPRKLDGFFGQQQDAAHLALGRDGHVRENHHFVHALILDGRHDGHIGFSRAQRLGAERGHRERQMVTALERPVGETPDERRSIQEFDDRDAQLTHASRPREDCQYSTAAGDALRAVNSRV